MKGWIDGRVRSGRVGSVTAGMTSHGFLGVRKEWGLAKKFRLVLYFMNDGERTMHHAVPYSNVQRRGFPGVNVIQVQRAGQVLERRASDAKCKSPNATNARKYHDLLSSYSYYT